MKLTYYRHGDFVGVCNLIELPYARAIQSGSICVALLNDMLLLRLRLRDCLRFCIKLL